MKFIGLIIFTLLTIQISIAQEKNAGYKVEGKPTRCVARADAKDRTKIEMKPSVGAKYVNQNGENRFLECPNNICKGDNRPKQNSYFVQKDKIQDNEGEGKICCTRLQTIGGKRYCVGKDKFTDKVEDPVKFVAENPKNDKPAFDQELPPDKVKELLDKQPFGKKDLNQILKETPKGKPTTPKDLNRPEFRSIQDRLKKFLDGSRGVLTS